MTMNTAGLNILQSQGIYVVILAIGLFIISLILFLLNRAWVKREERKTLEAHKNIKKIMGEREEERQHGKN